MHRWACGEVDSGTPALGDGELCPGGGRSVLQGLWGRRTGHTGLGGWGVQPRGWSEFPAGAAGMDNWALRPGVLWGCCPLLCPAVLCVLCWCCAVLVLCCAVLVQCWCHAMLRCAVLCCAVLVLCCAVLW